MIDVIKILLLRIVRIVSSNCQNRYQGLPNYHGLSELVCRIIELECKSIVEGFEYL